MRWWAVLVTGIWACSPGGVAGPSRDAASATDGRTIDTRDSDGDTIADVDEGSGDTDMDGTPDMSDLDSDADGIPDSVEAGDADVSTPPRDSDSDGTPDFQDTDSDGNGVPDAVEGQADTDGDGIPDFADTDDDNDRVPDASEIAESGPDLDTDGDGLVDWRDPDRDDDTILDGDERDVDTDMDGTPDASDLDSDADGIPDRDEAGDGDPFTPPVDTDGDMDPDFRDPDSDNDGLSDVDELARGTDWRQGDSDGDDVSDLIEVGAGTDPSDPNDNPRTRGDFVFVIPFEEAPQPPVDTLEFSTNIQIADVYFLFDTTTSMVDEIAQMRTAVTEVISDLTCQDFMMACSDEGDCADGQVCSLEGRCIEDPAGSSCVASVWTGVGTYEGGRNTYRNLLSLQPNPTTTQGRIPGSANGGGSDESLFESAACVADGSVCVGANCSGAGVGCPAFRMDAVRVLVTVTDERDECGNCNADSASAAGERLVSSGITFVGVDAATDHEPRAHLRDLANAAMSVDSAGQPLVFDGDGPAVRTAVTSAINEIVNGVPLEVTIEAGEEPGDDGDAVRFIDYLEVNLSGGACTNVSPVADTDADMHDDSFPELLPGTSVCWDVVPVTNTVQEPAASPLVYIAKLTVRGDGSPLDDRRVFFLVPPRIEIPMGPM